MSSIEIVDSLRSLYPLQNFEEQAVMEVVAELKACQAIGTVEELKAIKQWKSDIIESFSKYDVSGVDELMKRFRELTEKAAPKKPTIERVKFSHNQYADNYKCPTCGARMISKDETGWYSGRRSKYCEECGTAISWE